jgi:hypothetical protein
MRIVPYCRWSPLGAALNVEFPAELLSEMADPDEPDRGVFYGQREGREVRLLSSRTSPVAGDSQLGTVRLVGAYFLRRRGEVFLTEEDLEYFEKLQVDVALVIVGRRAGVFVREAGGEMESLRSLEEFLIPLLPELGAQPAVTGNAARPSRRAQAEWVWIAMAAALVLAVPLAGMTYFRPLRAAPLDLRVREHDGQLVISWNPRSKVDGGRLEIYDGATRALTMIQRGQTSATYAAKSPDVGVTLRRDPDRGPERPESVRYVAHPVVLAPVPQAPEEVTALERQVRILQERLAAGAQQIGVLEGRIREMVPDATPEP